MSNSSPPTRRVLDVLEELAASSGALTMPALVRHLGIPRSTMTAIVGELERAGWVVRQKDGYLLSASADAIVASRPAARLAEVLAEAGDDLGYPVNYFRVEDDELVVVGVHPQKSGGWHVTVGQRLPLLFPSGAASMPWRAADDVARWAGEATNRGAADLALDAARTQGCVFFTPDPSERSFDDVLRRLLGTIRDDEIPGKTKERLHAQLIRLTSVPCSAADVASPANFPVSYVAAPVRQVDGKIHELHVVVLGEGVSRERRDVLRRKLARWTDALGRIASAD